MRQRSLAAVLVVVTALLAPLLSAPASAVEPGATSLDPPGSTVSTAAAEQALETAQRVLDGEERATDPSPTLALRDLRAALPRLEGTERQEARGALARPTDGAADPYGDGYERPSSRQCTSTVCVHWIPRSGAYVDDDEVPNQAWVDATLAQLDADLDSMSTDYGYRETLPDGTRGGDARFDVYLADIGAQGLYGYCAPEQNDAESYAFCVLDNDYTESWFAAHTPLENMQVTSAHELFHAVQFAYDAWEDGWFMESTATWMEERLADGVNDNRAYLPYGQLGTPTVPLDAFQYYGLAQYGNWVFFETISERFGVDAVRQIWQSAASAATYSLRAVTQYLNDGRGGFRAHYGRFVALNSLPAQNYSEGAAYSAQPLALTRTLSPSRPRLTKKTYRRKHLSSRTVRLKPGSKLGSRWRLRVDVDLPNRYTGSEGVLLVRRRNGTSFLRRLSLDKSGRGTTRVSMNANKIAWVNVSLVNASTRFRCWRNRNYSCQGLPKDDGRDYTVWARVYRT